jgi:hypothetical protein
MEESSTSIRVLMPEHVTLETLAKVDPDRMRVSLCAVAAAL